VILGCDLDGVVADFATVANEWICETYGYEPVEPSYWDWFEQYPDGKMAWRSMWERANESGLFRRCPEVPGAVKGVKQLLDAGAEVVFVTHRNPRHAEHTVEWLIERGLPRNVAFLRDKSLLRADVYLDDKPETVAELLDLEYPTFLFDQPWNRDWELPRVSSWNEFVFMATVGFDPVGVQ
jgi:5'-nucleotidase